MIYNLSNDGFSNLMQYMYVFRLDKTGKNAIFNKAIIVNCGSVTCIAFNKSMSVLFIHPFTPLLYSETGVYRGIHFFLFLL